MKFRKIFLSLLIILFIILVYKRFQMKPYSPENVEFSYEHKDKHIYLTMKSKNDYKIYYTLDGTIPTKDSILYTDTIELDRYSTPDYLVLRENTKNISGNDIHANDSLPRGVVVRAIAIAPDKTKGKVNTQTFFPTLSSLYQNSTLISLVTDPKNLLDYETGIMVNGKVFDEWLQEDENNKDRIYFSNGNFSQKGKEWEREAVIEYFDGFTSLWKKNCGIRIRGNFSRMYNQKGFNVYFRDEYGSNKLKYELFPNNYSSDGKKISQYKSFSLSNGGNTVDGLKYSEDFLQSLVKDRNVDTEEGRLVIVFLNGEYWGVYLLQERYSTDYYTNHYNIHRNNLIVVSEGQIDIGKKEDISYYEDLMKYSELDLTNEDHYLEFLSKIDLQSMLDYFAIQIYIENSDWGNVGSLYKNTRLWRVRDSDGSLYGDGKWRWSLYDLGYYAESIRDPNQCSIDRAKEKHPLFASAMNNKNFEKEFYRTLEDIRVHNFNPKHVEEVFQSYYDLWNPYMLDQNRRFGSLGYDHIYSIDNIKKFFVTKYYKTYC